MNCLVCDLSINQGNVPICNACKRFFQRSLDKQAAARRNGSVFTMRCIDGTDNCTINSSNATAIGSGVVWRMACPKCRFEKCVALDIEKYCKPSSYRSQKTVALCTALPSPQSMLATEETVRQLVTATLKLSESLTSLPLLHNCRGQFRNHIDAWQIAAKHFEIGAIAVSQFLKAVPGYSKLALQERKVFFVKIAFLIMLAETNRLEKRPWSWSIESTEEFCSRFPTPGAFSGPWEDVAVTMKKWNPTTTEFACLLGYLFEKEFRSLKTETTCNGNPELCLAIESCFPKSTCSNRLRAMTQVAECLTAANKVRVNTLKGAYYFQPVLFTMSQSPLFDECHTFVTDPEF